MVEGKKEKKPGGLIRGKGWRRKKKKTDSNRAEKKDPKFSKFPNGVEN